MHESGRDVLAEVFAALTMSPEEGEFWANVIETALTVGGFEMVKRCASD